MLQRCGYVSKNRCSYFWKKASRSRTVPFLGLPPSGSLLLGEGEWVEFGGVVLVGVGLETGGEVSLVTGVDVVPV